MANTFTDFSQLTKSLLKKDTPKLPKPAPQPKPIPHPEKRTDASPDSTATEMSREDAECLAYFSTTSLTGRGYATAGRTKVAPVKPAAVREETVETDPVREAVAAAEAKFSREMDALRCDLSAAESRAASAERALEECRRNEEALQAECRRLNGLLQAKRSELPESEKPSIVVAPSPEVPREDRVRAERAVVSVPTDFDEVFPGELREMVLAALEDSVAVAKSSGRDRRATVLEAVLAANGSAAELDRRRAELKQILKDAAYYNDAQTIKALERLGFRLISGHKHWKLEYGTVRIPMAKTPSDYRANQNAAADISNRCF